MLNEVKYKLTHYESGKDFFHTDVCFPITLIILSKHYCVCCCCYLVTKSCPILCNHMGCSLSGSSVHGVFQARILEWDAISLSRDLPDPEIEPVSPALQVDSLLLRPLGSPYYCVYMSLNLLIIKLFVH